MSFNRALRSEGNYQKALAQIKAGVNLCISGLLYTWDFSL